MQPPALLIENGINELPCMGDGRQSGTSGSPSILNASPEAAVMGGFALVETGDMIRVDLNNSSVNLLIGDAELAQRRDDLEANGGFPIVEHHTPWEEIYRENVDQFDKGMVLKFATKYQKIAQKHGIPRDNH